MNFSFSRGKKTYFCNPLNLPTVHPEPTNVGSPFARTVG